MKKKTSFFCCIHVLDHDKEESENLRASISEIENNMATGRCGMGENNGGHNEGGR